MSNSKTLGRQPEASGERRLPRGKMKNSNEKSMHGIHIPEADPFLLFRLDGCISYFSLSLPTEEDLATCDRIVFTSPAEWDPYADAFAEEEAVDENAESGIMAGEAYDLRGDALCCRPYIQ
jgi:hypothetical protein